MREDTHTCSLPLIHPNISTNTRTHANAHRLCLPSFSSEGFERQLIRAVLSHYCECTISLKQSRQPSITEHFLILPFVTANVTGEGLSKHMWSLTYNSRQEKQGYTVSKSASDITAPDKVFFSKSPFPHSSVMCNRSDGTGWMQLWGEWRISATHSRTKILHARESWHISAWLANTKEQNINSRDCLFPF